MFYIAQNNQPAGPYSVDQIAAMVNAGSITSSTLTVVVGGTQWVPAHKVAELAYLFLDPVMSRNNEVTKRKNGGGKRRSIIAVGTISTFAIISVMCAYAYYQYGMHRFDSLIPKFCDAKEKDVIASYIRKSGQACSRISSCKNSSTYDNTNGLTVDVSVSCDGNAVTTYDVFMLNGTNGTIYIKDASGNTKSCHDLETGELDKICL